MLSNKERQNQWKSSFCQILHGRGTNTNRQAMKTQMDKDRENWTSLISMAVGCLSGEEIVFMSEGLE